MKTPSITILTKLVETGAEIDARRTEATAQLAAIQRERNQIIENATGPDDTKALAALTSLASREAFANHQIKLADQERAGLESRLLNEATLLKRDAAAALQARIDALAARLDDKLSEFYPNAKDRKAVLLALRGGSHPGIPTQPDIYRLVKVCSGLSGQRLDPQHGDALKFAKSIITQVNGALELIGK